MLNFELFFDLFNFEEIYLTNLSADLILTPLFLYVKLFFCMNSLYKLKNISFKFLYSLFTILFIELITFSTCFANSENYRVKNIEISEPYDLRFNKFSVIDKSFASAFKKLMEKILLSQDYDKIKYNNLNLIKSMVDSFSITDENFINNNYTARFEVLFDKEKVISFLNEKNIISSIPLKKNILFLPILVNIKKNQIFIYKDNTFYNNWNLENEKNYLLNYQLINEDIDDLNNIIDNYDNLENYDFDEILNKYSNKDFIIPIIYKNDRFIKILSKINIENNLSITKSEFNNIDINLLEDVNKIIFVLKKNYENFWKKTNQINTSIKLSLTISLDSKNYKLINNFENELKSSDLVNNFTIDSVNNRNIIYKIVYNSTPDKFIKSFENKKFRIDISNKIWILYE